PASAPALARQSPPPPPPRRPPNCVPHFDDKRSFLPRGGACWPHAFAHPPLCPRRPRRLDRCPGLAPAAATRARRAPAHLLDSLPDRSLPARRLRPIRRRLGPHHSPLRGAVDR